MYPSFYTFRIDISKNPFLSLVYVIEEIYRPNFTFLGTAIWAERWRVSQSPFPFICICIEYKFNFTWNYYSTYASDSRFFFFFFFNAVKVDSSILIATNMFQRVSRRITSRVDYDTRSENITKICDLAYRMVIR